MTSTTDWKAEEERWRHGIDVEAATDKDISDFTLYKLWEYKEYKTMDIGLWSFFQDDFGKFDANMFSKIHAQRLRNMYNFLRRGGVYVRTKDKRVTYAQLLSELTQEEQQHIWTQEELDEVYAELDGNEFQSNKLNNAIKRGLHYKIPTSRPQSSLQSELPPLATQPSQAATTQITTIPHHSTTPIQTLLAAPAQTPGWQGDFQRSEDVHRGAQI
jgi:hypothetical protein